MTFDVTSRVTIACSLSHRSIDRIDRHAGVTRSLSHSLIESHSRCPSESELENDIVHPIVDGSIAMAIDRSIDRSNARDRSIDHDRPFAVSIDRFSSLSI